jgi:hypothetical protein
MGRDPTGNWKRNSATSRSHLKSMWPLVEQRRHNLHATICGSSSTGEPPEISPEIRQQLSGLGPVCLAAMSSV